MIRASAILLMLVPFFAGAGEADPPEGAQLFARHCASCHTVGRGAAVGPDLAGVTGRRDRAWLARWIRDPAAMVRTDSTARALLEEWNGFTMPAMGLTAEEVEQVIEFLADPDPAAGDAVAPGRGMCGRGGHHGAHGPHHHGHGAHRGQGCMGGRHAPADTATPPRPASGTPRS